MQWLNFLLFPLVGAAIGAITNQVAIKMLFRPYKPIRIGRWRLPLTPGVIPSQRGTIAGNIAETFEANLLSGNEIHALITGEKVRQAFGVKLDELYRELGPLAAMLEQFKPALLEKILQGIEQVGTAAIADGGELNIGQRIEGRINAMDIAQLEELVLGFSRKQFRHITFFGGILGAVIGLVQALLSMVI